MKKVLILLIIIFLSCSSKKPEIYIFFTDNNQQIFYKTYIQLNNIEYIDENQNILKIPYDVYILLNMLQIEKLKMDVIYDNIANIKTTRTSHGGPYQRQYVDISLEDGISVKKDTETVGTYKFDPTHPDVISYGDFKDYVPLSNVDIVYENYNLNCSIQLFNSIVDYIQRNNIGIIIDKIPTIVANELDRQ
jgi:flagellar basal body rod protein FlgC